MSRWVLLVLALMGSFCQAQDVTQDNLQGKWVIISTNGADDGGREDGWTFAGNQWIVWSGGRDMQPDPYTLEENVVDLGYSKLRVLEKTPSRMKVSIEGSSIEYVLEKLE
ncbi:MAG: hypothetical protein ABWY06_23450 [Pseudomonas sp.]|uniref:hypothetical protein n=1 Tax=Pseudomonas sp. TaxID=306 RepID=UPI003397CB45